MARTHGQPPGPPRRSREDGGRHGVAPALGAGAAAGVHRIAVRLGLVVVAAQGLHVLRVVAGGLALGALGVRAQVADVVHVVGHPPTRGPVGPSLAEGVFGQPGGTEPSPPAGAPSCPTVGLALPRDGALWTGAT